MLFVSGKIRASRLTTCEACEHFVPSTRSCGPLVTEAFTDSPLCGCYMPAKTKLKVASCPLDKWEAIVNKQDIERIREFLQRDNNKRSAAELTELATMYLGDGQKAGSCGACNSKLMKKLEELVHNADTQA